MTGHDAPESAVTMLRNTHSVTWQAQQRPVVPAERLETLGPRADRQGLDLLITGLPQPAIVQIPFTRMPDLRQAVEPNPDFNQQISLLSSKQPTPDEGVAGVAGDNFADQPEPVVVSNPIDDAQLIPFNETVSILEEAQPEPFLTGIKSIPDFNFTPGRCDSPLDDAIERAATEQAVDVVEHIAGIDGLGLVLEIIEAAEGVTTPAGDGDNSRKSATRAKLQAAVATLKTRGGRVTQAAVAELAGVSLRTVKRQWQEVEGDI